ncbi:MAG: DUF5606 domain-containing protein [Bacteroidales bacterium]|nr:DUF5606 domain-containing protein [Bacteroidales bacterium]
MLKTILSISGKPGLYKLVSYGKNLVIVESLTDKKRFPAHSRDKIISLGDVAIYTTGDDKPLAEVLESAIAKFPEGVDAAEYKTDEKLAEFMSAILPEWDAERVYKTDIKKLIAWFNVLVKAGYTTFVEKAEAEAPAEEEK